MTTETTQELTVLLDLTQTEKDLQLAEQKHMNVVYDVKVPKEMQAAKQARKELKTMRTTVEGKRLEAGRVMFSMKQKNDEKAKGLIARIAAMEDPIDASIKAEEARIEAEKQAEILANNARIEAHREAIKRMREFPMSLQGKPADVMQVKLDQFAPPGGCFVYSDFDEFADEAKDAFTAACASANELIKPAREQEERDRIAAENERKLREMEERNAQLEREAEARRETDAKRERDAIAERERQEEAARDAEQKRLEKIAHKINIAVEAGEDLDGRGVQWIESRKQRYLDFLHENQLFNFEEFSEEWMQASRLSLGLIDKALAIAQERAEQEAARQKKLDDQAAAQRAEQERLDQQRREHEAQVERDRIAKLGLMEAVRAVVNDYDNGVFGKNIPQSICDLAAVYETQSQEKRAAAKPTRAKVK
jgi:colicin import membrane protein